MAKLSCGRVGFTQNNDSHVARNAQRYVSTFGSFYADSNFYETIHLDAVF